MSKYQAIMGELSSTMASAGHSAKSRESSWIMEIKDTKGKSLTDSSISTKGEGAGTGPLKTFVPIYDYQFGISRGLNDEVMNAGVLPSELVAHELKIVAPIGSIKPAIHTAFSHNTILKSVKLARVGTVAGNGTSSKIFNQYEFVSLYITAIISKDDLISMAFRYTSVSYTRKSYNATTGATAGSDVTAYHNFHTGSGKKTGK